MLTAEESNILIGKYRNLLGTCKPVLRKGDSGFIREAMNLVLQAYADDRNLFGEPSLFSDLDHAEITAGEIGLGKIPVASSILLSSFIKGKISETQVRSLFGPQLAAILTGVRRISSLKIDKVQPDSENFIRLVVNLSGDIRVILIRLAETLYYLKNYEKLPQDLRLSKAREAYYLYVPLAHRLGLYQVKTVLEDLSMRILFPAEYSQISTKLAESTDARNDYIRQFIFPLEKLLKAENFSFEIRGRPKSVHSIWTKMKKQQVPFEEVYDILAIRIVLENTRENEKSDCWRVYSLVTDLYPPNPVRLRDWISAPKASGYEALHTTVQGPQGKWIEVQIRTRRMDEAAEKGRVAHWRYKENKISGESDEWLNNLRNLLESPASERFTNDDQGRIEVTDPHIFVFTPQGDLKQLQPGSSVLDFAFHVHSDIGLKCTGARVNGKNVPIRHVLSNGDEVEIITAKNQKPASDWINFVVTAKAKQKIRQTLREEGMKQAEAGKETLLRKLKNWKLPSGEENIDKAVKLLKFKTHVDFYNAIATGALDPLKIKEALVRLESEEPPAPPAEKKTTAKKTDEKKEDFIYLDQHLVDINYTLASCCNPIFGDNVFGFVTVSKGLSVHRATCPNAKDLVKRYNYRIIRVKWRENIDSTAFQASIRIQGIDSPGILNTISEVINRDLDTNIRSVSLDSDKGIFKGTIKVFVRDIKHLEMIIHRLEKLKGVLKVNRVD